MVNPVPISIGPDAQSVAEFLADAVADVAQQNKDSFDHDAVKELHGPIPLAQLQALYRKPIADIAQASYPELASVLITLLNNDWENSVEWSLGIRLARDERLTNATAQSNLVTPAGATN